MINIAHRGACSTKPENTMAAFHEAVKQGADAIELDARRCASGEVMVIHDASVDRTTDGSGKVSRLSKAGLRKLDAGDGEKIPELSAVLHTFSTVKNLLIFIELKDRHVQQVVACVQTAQRQGRVNLANVCFFSLNPFWLKKLKQAMPEARIFVSFPRMAPFGYMLWVSRFCHAEGVIPHYTSLRASSIQRLRRADLQVLTWGANSTSDIRHAVNCDVDGVMADCPDVTAQVFAGHELDSDTG